MTDRHNLDAAQGIVYGLEIAVKIWAVILVAFALWLLLS